MKKAPTRVFSWFKAPTSSFTFKTIIDYSYTALLLIQFTALLP